MTTTASARRCAFCGSTGPMTNEHVWNDWLRDVLPSEPLPHTSYAGHGGTPGPGWSALRRPYRFTVKCVCSPCNSGWMSRIDSAAKPAAKAAVLGEARVLDETSQTALARWVFLK